jgi:exonuclease III
MKGLFWNSNGLRDPAKNRFLFEISQQQDLDFISILESKRKEFHNQELSYLCGHKNFTWSWSLPHGQSGGILVGVYSDKFQVDQIIKGNFHVKFKLKNNSDKFEWVLISVYGPAQGERKYSFLQELTQICNEEKSPIMVGGDFNIIRGRREKNNNRYDDRWPFLFNAVINSLNLREIELSGRQYTWANNLLKPTYEKLDRVLITTEWELKYPRVMVQALNRELSDHSPLLLDSRQSPKQHKVKLFKFELSWFLKEEFYELVTEVWHKENRGSASLEK